jgi:hypothetical protein
MTPTPDEWPGWAWERHLAPPEPDDDDPAEVGPK